MDNQRAIQLLQAHIDAEDMPLFSQAAGIGIRAIERVAALEAELATANLQADQYLRALVEIGHKLSIENAEQFHTAAYAQGRIIDAIIERRVEAEAELAEARKEIEALRIKPWQEQIDGQAETISRLRYELAEARKDGDRYRYIRTASLIHWCRGKMENLISWPTIRAAERQDGGNYRDRFDAAIDAARAQEGKG